MGRRQAWGRPLTLHTPLLEMDGVRCSAGPERYDRRPPSSPGAGAPVTVLASFAGPRAAVSLSRFRPFISRPVLLALPVTWHHGSWEAAAGARTALTAGGPCSRLSSFRGGRGASVRGRPAAPPLPPAVCLKLHLLPLRPAPSRASGAFRQCCAVGAPLVDTGAWLPRRLSGGHHAAGSPCPLAKAQRLQEPGSFLLLLLLLQSRSRC